MFNIWVSSKSARQVSQARWRHLNNNKRIVDALEQMRESLLMTDMQT